MLNELDKLRQKWQKENQHTGLLINCGSCFLYDRDNDQCGKFNCRPPIDVIIIGCDSWEQDIPF